MEYFFYKQTKIHYEYKVDAIAQLAPNIVKSTIVFLHGWGADMEMMKIVGNKINGFDKLYIDFPPFGKSEEPKKPWTIYDYANLVKGLCDKLCLKNIILISHSFGGRVALILSNVYNENISKIILIDSAGIKPRRKLSYYTRVLSFKLRHIFNKKAKGGSIDYQNLSPIMKQTFKSIVSTDLKKFAKNNKIETLIIWGKKDYETPLYMAKKLNRLIQNSGLIVFEEAGHFSFLDNYDDTILIVNNFINQG